MQPFDRVVLIFNPNSTGNASGLAAELMDELAARQPDLPVMLQQTEHAGHARDLARDAALMVTRWSAVCCQRGTPTITGAPPRSSCWPYR